MNSGPFKNMDQRFRDAAKNAEPEFDPAAWKRMEARLDKENRKRRFFWWWLPAALLLGGAGVYFLMNNNRVKEQAVTAHHSNVVTSVSSSVIQEKQSVSVERNTNEHVLPTDDASSISAPIIHPATPAFPSTYKQNVSSKKRNAIQQKPSRIKMAVTAAVAEDDHLIQENVESKIFIEDDFAIARHPPQIIPVEGDGLNLSTDSMAAELKREEPENKVADSSSLPKKLNETGSRKKGSFFLWAAGGAEASAVSFDQLRLSNTAAKWGFGAGYAINERWAVMAGAFRTDKQYSAGKDDYRPKDNSYLAAADSVSITADCAVWEIPLLLRYTIHPNSATRFYVSGGVAGVIMKKEDYRFNYTMGITPYVYSYSDEKSFTGNRHFLAFGRLSAGVEKQLSKRFAFQAEPYIIFPMSGVGEGRVKLLSLGVQAGISFQPF